MRKLITQKTRHIRIERTGGKSGIQNMVKHRRRLEEKSPEKTL